MSVVPEISLMLHEEVLELVGLHVEGKKEMPSRLQESLGEFVYVQEMIEDCCVAERVAALAKP